MMVKPTIQMIILLTLVFLAGSFFASEACADWRSWRGPTFNGVAASGQSPVTAWDENQNIIWKTKLEGRGHSSPTILGDRIYLTTGDGEAETQSVVCFDRGTGERVWKVDVSRGGLPRIHRNNTHASSTVASDGERLFVSFHHHGLVEVVCLTLAGEVVWRCEVGPYDPQKYKYGYGASPFLYEGLVLIGAECEERGFLAGLDQVTGEVRWRTPRPSANSYASPVVVKIGGRDQLVISGGDEVSSYDPLTGKRYWAVEGTTFATSGTAVWDGDIVIVSGGYPKSETVAVDASGVGKVVWRNKERSYEQSMLAHAGYVYALTDKGIAFCWRVKDGKEMWQERLKGPVSSSLVLVDDVIYVTNEKGTTYVFRASADKFELIAENKLGADIFATLTVVDSRIYYRSGTGRGEEREEFLYCIGNE